MSFLGWENNISVEEIDLLMDFCLKIFKTFKFLTP